MTLEQELNYWNDLYLQEINIPNHDEVRSSELNDYRKECLKEYKGFDIGTRTRPIVE